MMHALNRLKSPRRPRLLPLAMMAACLTLPIGLKGMDAHAAATYAKDYVGEVKILRAKYEDTLVHLARQYGLGYVAIRAANPGVDPWIPGEGARVVIPTQHILPDAPREGIVINLPEMRLYYYEFPGQAPLNYSISPGREGLHTPIGTTTIVSKKEGPTWRPTARMLKEDPTLKPFYPPGPDNPLGTHAMYLGWPEYRIHGTNKPYAIGRMASSGCIRMYPESIRDLYPRVPTGTKVTVVDQPIKVGWIKDKMFIEVHPTQEQSVTIERDGELKSYEITSDDMKRITSKAGALANQIDWEAVRKAVREHKGYPIAILDKSKGAGAHVQDDIQAELDREKAADADKVAADAAAQKPAAAPVTAKKAIVLEKNAKAKAEKAEAIKTAAVKSSTTPIVHND